MHCPEAGTYVLNVEGAGALSSPLLATQFAQLPHWSFHYLVSLAIASINTVLLVSVFRFKSQDGSFLLRLLHTTRLSHYVKSAWLRLDSPQERSIKTKAVI